MPSYSGWKVLGGVVFLSLIWSYCGLKFPFISLSYDSVLTFAVAVMIMMVTLKIRMKTSRIINSIAASTYAVYLIHQNYYVKDVLAEYMIYYPELGFTANFFIGIGNVAILFLMFVAIDKVRIYLFELCRIPRFQQWLSDRVISTTKGMLARN